MKQSYVSVAVMLCITVGWGQSPFLKINSENAKDHQVSFYGTDLSDKINEESSVPLINYNPAWIFNGADDYMEVYQKISDLSQVTIYTVFQSESDSGSDTEIWGIHGEESELALTSTKAYNTNKESYYAGGDSEFPVLHTYTQLYRSNKKNPKADTYLSLGVIKKDSVNKFFKGKIAEVIAFKRILRGSKRQKIETALALKYGITLQGGDNYISSEKNIVWDSENDYSFSNRIIGIGRDDASSFLQKQSASSEFPDFLAIGVNEIAPSNVLNSGAIDNLTYWVAGDNNLPLLEEPQEESATRIPTLFRKWLVKCTGDHVSQLSTQLKLNAATLFDSIYIKEHYLLVIDETGKGNFASQNTRYIEASSVSPEGLVVFNDIQWDADGSGKDMFSFALKRGLDVSLTDANPNICPQETTSLRYKATGGFPPYTYALYKNENPTAVKQWDSTEDAITENLINDLDGGSYKLKVTDALGNSQEQTEMINKETLITVNLGSNRKLKYEESFVLTPSLTHAEKIQTYLWTFPDGLTSSDSYITITQAGTYKLTVVSQAGCEYSDEVVIEESFIKDFTLYPNQSTDGNYSISVQLAAPASIRVSVFDMAGNLVSDFLESEKQQLTIAGQPIIHTGIYNVVLETPQETVTKKLIVE